MSKKGKKFKGQKKPSPQRAKPARPEVLPALNLGLMNAATVAVRDFDYVQIILAGAGGNGAFLAQHIGRLMRVIYESGKGAHLTICDPDIVEEKNIGRQNFCDAEVGMPKAEAVARRYGHAWGLNCTSYVGKYDESLIIGMGLTILVGCVDNAEARRALFQTLMQNDQSTHDGLPSVWWLDLGNLKDTGRVLLGSSFGYDGLEGAFSEPRKCISLPGPALQMRDLLTPRPEELEAKEMSCAEMAAANLQSLTINARLAAEGAAFLARMLVTRDLKRFQSEVNTAAGTSRSTYVTPEEVARVIKKPLSFLTRTATSVREERVA